MARELQFKTLFRTIWDRHLTETLMVKLTFLILQLSFSPLRRLQLRYRHHFPSGASMPTMPSIPVILRINHHRLRVLPGNGMGLILRGDWPRGILLRLV